MSRTVARAAASAFDERAERPPAVKNGSKTYGRSRGSMPTPESVTSTVTCPVAKVVRIEIEFS
jgi:hypothetical protein